MTIQPEAGAIRSLKPLEPEARSLEPVDSEARDVRQTRGDRADFVERCQQHRGRVPLAAQERVAQRGGIVASIVRLPAVTVPVSTSAVDDRLGVALDQRLQRVDGRLDPP